MSEGELRSLKVKGGVSFYMVEEKGSLQVRKEDDLLRGGGPSTTLFSKRCLIGQKLLLVSDDQLDMSHKSPPIFFDDLAKFLQKNAIYSQKGFFFFKENFFFLQGKDHAGRAAR